MQVKYIGRLFPPTENLEMDPMGSLSKLLFVLPRALTVSPSCSNFPQTPENLLLRSEGKGNPKNSLEKEAGGLQMKGKCTKFAQPKEACPANPYGDPAP